MSLLAILRKKRLRKRLKPYEVKDEAVMGCGPSRHHVSNVQKEIPKDPDHLINREESSEEEAKLGSSPEQENAILGKSDTEEESDLGSESDAISEYVTDDDCHSDVEIDQFGLEHSGVSGTLEETGEKEELSVSVEYFSELHGTAPLMIQVTKTKKKVEKEGREDPDVSSLMAPMKHWVQGESTVTEDKFFGDLNARRGDEDGDGTIKITYYHPPFTQYCAGGRHYKCCYVGQVKNHQFNGKGEIRVYVSFLREGAKSFPDTSKSAPICTYSGGWKENRREGKGTLRICDLIPKEKKEKSIFQAEVVEQSYSEYSGLWRRHYLIGKGEQIVMKDGEMRQKYCGTFCKLKMEGKKDCQFEDLWSGVKYVGGFKNDKFHGRGKLTSEKYVYCGNFKYGLPHGKVKRTELATKNVFDGSFNKGAEDWSVEPMHTVFSGGRRFYGKMKRTKAKEGEGENLKLIPVEGTLTYSMEHDASRLSYRGLFKNGKPCDEKGKIVYVNESEYTGGVVDGVKHGKGELVCRKGKFRIIGEWNAGKMIGKMKIIEKPSEGVQIERVDRYDKEGRLVRKGKAKRKKKK